MKIIAIIQARMGSTRLPGKVLMRIQNKPTVWHLVNRLKYSKLLNKIVIATSVNKKDDILANYLKKNKIKYYRGNENNLLERYYKTALSEGCCDSDIIVRISADDILIDPKITDILLRKYLNIKRNRSMSFLNNPQSGGFPYGMGLQIFSFKVLKKTYKNATNNFEKEHVCPYIINHPGIFNIITVKYEEDFSYIKLSIDYPEDLRLVRAIFKKLYKDDKSIFSLNDICLLFKRQPELLEINRMYSHKIINN